ncbi:MAG: hypothetical protein ACK56I_30750, partial [bacterium]
EAVGGQHRGAVEGDGARPEGLAVAHREVEAAGGDPGGHREARQRGAHHLGGGVAADRAVVDDHAGGVGGRGVAVDDDEAGALAELAAAVADPRQAVGAVAGDDGGDVGA